jgi:ribonuclease HI
MLRGTRVLARVDADGKPVPGEGGRVEVRYKPTDAKAYRAGSRNLEAIAGEEVLPDDTCAPASSAASKTAATSKSKSERAERVASMKHPEGTIIVYADGACSGNPGPAGVGVVVQDERGRHELSHFLGIGTNNIAELTAILEAAKAIETPDRAVRIHTDSKYAIGVLSMGWKAKANVELVANVKNALKPFSDLKLIHVPGHAGVVLNERADVLAVQAVKTAASSGWIHYPTSSDAALPAG